MSHLTYEDRLPYEDRAPHEQILQLLGYAVIFGYAERGREGIRQFFGFYVGIDAGPGTVGSDWGQYITPEMAKAALYKCSTTGC